MWKCITVTINIKWKFFVISYKTMTKKWTRLNWSSGTRRSCAFTVVCIGLAPGIRMLFPVFADSLCYSDSGVE